MAELSFAVDDLRCASCVDTVERAMREVPGVEDASVNLALKRARARFDPERASPEQVLEAVRRAGYHAVPVGEEREEGRDVAFFVAAALGVSVLVLDHVVQIHEGPLLFVEAALAVAVVLLAGRSFFGGAIAATRRLRPNMDVLVALGVSAALGWSLAALAVPSLRRGHLSFEAAALLVVFVRGGRLLESRARARATSALRALLAREAKTALVREGDATREVAADAIDPGDIIIIRPGETVAADAKIEEGRSAFDLSFLTGESIPRELGPGDEVPGGAVNGGGSVVARAVRPGRESAIRRVAKMVEDAQAEKAPVQRLADSVAAVFVPAVIAVALVTGIGWFLATSDVSLALARAVTVIVVACPCALGLATPTALVVGSSVGLRRGILIKKAPALEALGRATTMVLDKTGTLTRGRPTVVAVEGDVLALAAAAAERSTHPLARAIAQRGKGLELPLLLDHEERWGRGVVAKAESGERVLLGARALLDEEKVALPDALAARAAGLARDGASTVFVARGGVALGLVALRDEPRPEAREAVERLRALGVEPLVLSGDRRPAVEAVAKAVGIERFEAELAPDAKLARIAALPRERGLVAMVGDGVNDAPALARADVGIALGAGSDVAKEAGDVVLARDDLRDAPRAIALGRASLANVKQNLALAFVYNLVLIPVAAGLVRGLEIGPAWAGLAMALSSITVVLNALRLERARIG